MSLFVNIYIYVSMYVCVYACKIVLMHVCILFL